MLFSSTHNRRRSAVQRVSLPALLVMLLAACLLGSRRTHAQDLDFAKPPRTLDEQLDDLLVFEERRLEYLNSLAEAQRPYEKAELQLDLARLYDAAGDLEEAENWYRKALGNWEALSVEDPFFAEPYYATCRDLVGLYVTAGDFQQAKALLDTTQARLARQAAEARLDVTQLFEVEAELYRQMGDDQRAVHLLQLLLEKTESEDPRRYSTALHNLAITYSRMGQYELAERLLRRELELSLERLRSSRRNPGRALDYAHSQASLALTLTRRGKYDEARELFGQVQETYVDLLGPQHPLFIRSLSNIGFLLIHTGDYDRAEQSLTQAAEVRSQRLGPGHLDHADSVNDLARLFYTKGDYAAAVQRSRQALDITRHNIEQAFASQSERQQLAIMSLFRDRLDLFVAAALAAGTDAADVYEHVLHWKGAVFARQQSLRRAAQGAASSEEARQLQATARQLAALAVKTPAPDQLDAWQAKINELRERKERLEQQLAAQASNGEAAASPAEVRQCLPDDCVLIDYLEFTARSWSAELVDQPQRRLAAFVVAPDRPITLLDLGSTEPMARAAEDWRKAFGSGEGYQHARQLRHMLWEPLAAHLGDAQTVLLSLDGVATRVPFVALAGAEPGSYLIEDFALAAVPVPQVLPRLLGRTAQKEVEGVMLVMGDIDFDAHDAQAEQPTRTARRFGHRSLAGVLERGFEPLEGTRGEISTIEKMYREKWGAEGLTTLNKAAASEDAFRRQAPNHLYLHLATHGYFAPPGRSALDRQHQARASSPDADQPLHVEGLDPGLLSGLALAGANAAAGADAARAELDDGILTAEEVATLDLNGVEMAVLSACETGLGQQVAGEGLLGLQRSFQVAGARTVVASSWKVDDGATRDLMERFYANLWKGMGTLEALREAQRWMMSQGKVRGLVDLDADQFDNRRLPPFYWAAFVLSGDWR